MNKLCVTQSSHGNLTPRRNEQRLLRNMGIHSVVLELLQVCSCHPRHLLLSCMAFIVFWVMRHCYKSLVYSSSTDDCYGNLLYFFHCQIPYDHKEDKRMNELIELAHQFLQNFCLGDRPNQALLYKSIDLFLNPGVSICCRWIARWSVGRALAFWYTSYF